MSGLQARAAVLTPPSHDFELQEVDIAPPRGDEILVRIHATGICHTDVVFAEHMASKPVVLGHEGAGVVEAVGDRVERVAPGDHVVLSFASCGSCVPCWTGSPAYCDKTMALNFGTCRLDGSSALSRGGEPLGGHFFGQSSFADLAIAYESNAVKVPTGVPLDIVAPFGCGIQTGAAAVLNELRPRPGSSLAIFGAGGVGMAALFAARIAACATIVAVDMHKERLDLALALGASHAIDASGGAVVDELREIAPGGIDYTVDTTGNASAVRLQVESLRMGGTTVLIGGPPPGGELVFDHMSFLVGRKLQGTIQGNAVPHDFIPMLIEQYQQGRFPVDRLIERFKPDEINTAIRRSHDGSAIKPVLCWQ